MPENLLQATVEVTRHKYQKLFYYINDMFAVHSTEMLLFRLKKTIMCYIQFNMHNNIVN